MENNNNLNNNLKSPKNINKRSNLYMTLIIVTTLMSVICVSVIVGILYWLYINNNIGREEYKAAHIAAFVFAIIEVALMVVWFLGMLGSVIIFRRLKATGKLRFYIHYIGVLSFHIIFGIVVYVLFWCLLEWRIMDADARQKAFIVIVVFEIIRILLLLSIFVTSIIYLRKSKRIYKEAQQIINAPQTPINPVVEMDNEQIKNNI